MLGWMRASRGDLTLMRFRTQKTALLLARLALFPQRTHPREELADLLWPDADQEAGRNRLKQSLAILRRLLEPPGMTAGSVLIADRGAVRLNPAAVFTDVAEFEAALRDAARLSGADRTERLRQAAALYQGELLPGVYDDWVTEERERLVAVWELAQAEARGAALAPAQTIPTDAPAAPPPTSPVTSSVTPAAPRLPLLFTRFFGRERERADLAALLGDESVRLITLTGPGGTGKTRLAVEAARQAAGGLKGQVHFVPLADLADPSLISDAVADALGVTRTSSDEPLECAAAALAAAPALLVLDNLEQMGEGVASPLLALLTRVPTLTILVTSRSRLFIAGEREYPLAPLPTPQRRNDQSQPAPSPESLLVFPGVQLFADRAQAARPDFQITARNAEAIADICRRLEGIPLALELAAAWSSLLTPAQMRERLGQRFTLLRSRRKDVTERHQTLWAAISWSYDLLPPDLARFWTRLSVFRGGFTAEAAQEVCEEPCALEWLGRLRARSLVLAEEAGDEMRFRLLETLREFGWAQQEREEQSRIAACHAAHFMRLAEQAEPLLTGPDQTRWLNRLGDDQDNLRGALDWDESANGDAGRGLRIAGALWRFWAIRGPLSEGRRRLEQALERSGSGRRRRLYRAGEGAEWIGRPQPPSGRHEGRQASYSGGVWRSGGWSGMDAASHLRSITWGRWQRCKEITRRQSHCCGKGLALWRELGKEGAVAQTLSNLAFLAHEQEDFEAAHTFCEESLRLARALGDRRGAALSLSIQAEIAAETGEYAQAQSLYAEVFEVAAEVGDLQMISDGLAVLGRAALVRDMPERAARLLGAGKALNDTVGYHEKSRAQTKMYQAIEDARRALPPPTFAAAWAEGQAMTAEQAVTSALDEAP